MHAPHLLHTYFFHCVASFIKYGLERPLFPGFIRLVFNSVSFKLPVPVQARAPYMYNSTAPLAWPKDKKEVGHDYT